MGKIKDKLLEIEELTDDQLNEFDGVLQYQADTMQYVLERLSVSNDSK